MGAGYDTVYVDDISATISPPYTTQMTRYNADGYGKYFLWIRYPNANCTADVLVTQASWVTAQISLRLFDEAGSLRRRSGHADRWYYVSVSYIHILLSDSVLLRAGIKINEEN
jgi:hypothetical protein